MKLDSILKQIKKYKVHLLCAFVFTLLLFLIVTLLIRNIYNILLYFGEETLGNIFSQLDDAYVIPPFILQFIILFLMACLVLKVDYSKNKIIKIIFISIICLIIFIILLVISILLSSVNGVLFIDVLVSLLKNMGGLGL